jgi:cysteine desulfurase
VGALLMRKKINIISQISGGKQEGGMRAGTHNVPGIVGMSVALTMIKEYQEQHYNEVINLRDQLIQGVLDRIKGSFLTGDPSNRLPNHASFVFEGINGNDLLIALDMAGFAVSSGSACKVGNPSPSEVLLALGFDASLALGSLRVTLGKNSTMDHVDRFLAYLPGIITGLRG